VGGVLEPAERSHKLSKTMFENLLGMATHVVQRLFPEPLIYQRFVVLACFQFTSFLRAQRCQRDSLTVVDAFLRVAAEGVGIVA